MFVRYYFCNAVDLDMVQSKDGYHNLIESGGRWIYEWRRLRRECRCGMSKVWKVRPTRTNALFRYFSQI